MEHTGIAAKLNIFCSFRANKFAWLNQLNIHTLRKTEIDNELIILLRLSFENGILKNEISIRLWSYSAEIKIQERRYWVVLSSFLAIRDNFV